MSPKGYFRLSEAFEGKCRPWKVASHDEPEEKSQCEETNYKANYPNLYDTDDRRRGVGSWPSRIRSCCCWVRRRYSGGSLGRPERASITMRTKHDEARPHLFTPKGGDRNGERLDQQISILPPLIRPRTRHPHEGQARPSLLWANRQSVS